MNEKMNILKAKVDEIANYIDDKNDVVFLDYPFYHNVGDLLIYAGVLNFFSKNKIKVRAYRCVDDFNILELKKIITSSTVIICQGGGNFGDIYIHHQRLREEVVGNFLNNKIIILPQTAHFISESELQRSANIFKQHDNVIIFSRDINSLNIFKRFSKHVMLMPDMAHHLNGELNISSVRKSETLYFIRRDIESSHDQSQYPLPKNAITYDWDDLISSYEKNKLIALKKLVALARITNSTFLKNIAAWLWRNTTKKLTYKYAYLFSTYQDIVTSRMHGHILSCLVETPNVLINNSYGKNSGYFQEWTADIGLATLYKSDEKN